MILYKYLARQYLDSFRKEGRLYINTLYNLRTCSHEPARDQLEGKFRAVVEPTDKPISLSSKEAHQLFPKVTFAEDIKNNAITVMPKAHLASDREIEDAFVFCSSLSYNNNLKKKFEYDSIFGITEPTKFADLIYEELSRNNSMIGYLMDRVIYSEKKIRITEANKGHKLSALNKTFPEYWFRKPLTYKEEKEFRMVFLPKSDASIKPVEIVCPTLLEFCLFNI